MIGQEYESPAVCEQCGLRYCICSTLGECAECRCTTELARLDVAMRCEDCAGDYEDEDQIAFERQHAVGAP